MVLCGLYPTNSKSSKTKSSMDFLLGLSTRRGKWRGVLSSCCFKGSTWLVYTWASPDVCTNSPGRRSHTCSIRYQTSGYIHRCRTKVLGRICSPDTRTAKQCWCNTVVLLQECLASNHRCSTHSNMARLAMWSAGTASAHLCHHVCEQCVAGNVEGHAQAHVCTALVQLTGELPIANVELEAATQHSTTQHTQSAAAATLQS